MDGPLLTIVLVVAGIWIYFIPTLIAAGRKHHQAAAIAVLNLFTGWFVLGWVAALIWACTATRDTAPA